MTDTTPELDDPFAVIDRTEQHVLVIYSDGGFDLCHPDNRDFSSSWCTPVLEALIAFAGTAGGKMEGPPGAFWCNVADDGNFEIGSRLTVEHLANVYPSVMFR